MCTFTYEGKTGVWCIRREPKPIPSRKFDYDFWHEDYDGPEDGRCGNAASPAACVARIEEMEADDEG